MTEPTPPRRRPGRPATGQTPGHNLPMPTDRWNRLGDVAEERGIDRTKLINALVAWLLREPGARRPERVAEPESD